jgi:predicted permease
MNFNFRRLKRRLRYWLRHSERHQLLREEMEFHIDALARDLIEQGVPEQDARSAARRRFGNLTQKSEQSRSTWISGWMSDGAQDLRHAGRTLRRDAGFAIFALLILGLGIGACCTIFSVVNALLLRPLPFNDPERLVWILNRDRDGEGLSGETVPVGHFVELRDRNRSFSDIAAYYAFYGVGDSKLSGDGQSERLSGIPVSQNFFSVLGVKPQIGRTFNAEECSGKWGAPKAVLLSYGIWKRRFAFDPGIIGRPVMLNDAPVTVVGVLPASFDFATVFAPGSRIDLYLPLPLTEEVNRRGNTVSMIGRLKSRATVQQARAEMSVLGPQIQKKEPDRNFDPRLSLLKEHVTGRLRPALLVLAGAVCLVMLIVCANLSNLLLARAATRQKEMAIRAALGAGRGRLIRQMLTESIVLSGCGAVLGLIFAVSATRVLRHLDAFSIPLLESVHVDFGALGFALLLAVLTGLLFGVIPALQVPATAFHDSLKDASRGSSHGRKHAWIRGTLVVSEVALACSLLVGAGLLIRSFLSVLDVNVGFQPERAAALRVDPSSQYSTQAQRNLYFDEALRRVRLLPGIQAAGLTDALPLGSDRTWYAGAKSESYSKDRPPPPAFVRIVSDGYLQAMGIPLRAGRDLTERDTVSAQPVILINETLARTLWPGRNPIGQTVTYVDVDRQVIGVVGDVRHTALEETSGCEMYLPIRQTNDYSSVDLVVRTTLPPGALASAIRLALKPLEPDLPANEFRTLQQLVDRAVSPRRFVVILLAAFAAFAVMLASLGIYAVISYAVNQRTQELGIRMALGASARDLQARILLRTLSLAGLGMLIGVTASSILSRLLGGLLFGVTPTDPVTFLGMFVILTAVAAIAGYLPARRASRIDPMVALRSN